MKYLGEAIGVTRMDKIKKIKLCKDNWVVWTS